MDNSGFQSIYNDPALQSAKQGATQAQQTALAGQVAQQTLPDMLRQALTSKFSTDNPLVADIQGARENAMNTFTGAPLSVLPENNNGMVFNPNQQADLIQRQRSAATSNLSSLNDLFGINVGGIQNVIDSTGRAFGAQQTAQQGKATLAQNSVDQILKELTLKQQELEAYKQQLLQKQGLQMQGTQFNMQQLLEQMRFGESKNQFQQTQQLEQQRLAEQRAQFKQSQDLSLQTLRASQQQEAAKLAETIREYDATLKLDTFKANKPDASSGTNDLINKFLLGQNASTPTTPTKTVDPKQFVVQDKKTSTKPAAPSLNLTSAFAGSGIGTPVSTSNKAPSNSLTTPLDWNQLFR